MVQEGLFEKFPCAAVHGMHDFPPSTAGEEGCLHHGPRFDFNDSALPVGAAFRASLVETELPVT